MNPVQYRNDASYISGGDISGDVTGSTIDAAQFRQVSFVAVNTGNNSPAGNIFIQFSNDNSTFINGSGTATTAISGAENNELTATVFARYIRIFFDHTSGGSGATFSVSYTLKS